MKPVTFATVSASNSHPVQPLSSSVPHPSESQIFGLLLFLLALWLLPIRPQRHRG